MHSETIYARKGTSQPNLHYIYRQRLIWLSDSDCKQFATTQPYSRSQQTAKSDNHFYTYIHTHIFQHISHTHMNEHFCTRQRIFGRLKYDTIYIYIFAISTRALRSNREKCSRGHIHRVSILFTLLHTNNWNLSIARFVFSWRWHFQNTWGKKQNT